MQISFNDAQKLLLSAVENNCLILMDGIPVNPVCQDDYIYCEEKERLFRESEVFHGSRSRVDIDIDAIVIENHQIQIYKKPVTKEEYLTTLEFLKNEQNDN